VAYITLPPPAAPKMPRMTPVTPPPRPPIKTEAVPAPPKTSVIPTPTPPPAPIDTQPTPAVASAPVDGRAGTAPGANPGAGGSTGGGEGAGIGPGQGAGPGAGGGGAGGTIRPPELRDLAFPFDTPPKELRGASLAVTFWVRVDGRVDRYEVAPEIADRDYARKFDEVIRAFRFTPARAPDGTTVAGTTTVTFTLPGKRNS
jgi:hypothetical protein